MQLSIGSIRFFKESQFTKKWQIIGDILFPTKPPNYATLIKLSNQL